MTLLTIFNNTTHTQIYAIKYEIEVWESDNYVPDKNL